MNTLVLAVTFALAALLAGCQSAVMPEPVPPPTSLPSNPRPSAPVSGTNRNSNLDHRSDGSAFPVEVAGYRRGLAYGMNRGPLDASIAYDRVESDINNTVTLFIRRQPGDVKALLPHEKSLIRQMHSETSLLSEKEIVLTKKGRTYPAIVATFQYTDLFAGQRQALFSQLILVQVKDRVLKVRSTAPIAHASEAQRDTLRLLDQVSWGPGEPR